MYGSFLTGGYASYAYLATGALEVALLTGSDGNDGAIPCRFRTYHVPTAMIPIESIVFLL